MGTHMKDTALYEQLLGIKDPWIVKTVELCLDKEQVIVELVLKENQIWADPIDPTKRAHIHGWNKRHWRHLDTCQFETIITARVPQLKYSDGTVAELAVPWADRYSRVTVLMTGFVIKLLQVCSSTQAVCNFTRLSWGTVNAIMVNAVERGMLRRTEEEITHLGIDEKSSEKGHTYVSILTDIDRSRVLDLVPNRKLADAMGLLKTLTPSQRQSVQAIAMDMWAPYISAAKQCLPEAAIVHDKFHIAKYLGEAVNQVRKQEHRKLSVSGTSPLTGSKWAWLKKYPDGRSSEAVSFRDLNQLNLKTSRAWCIKENFSQFWAYHYKGAALRFFKAWSNHAMRSRLEPIKKVVKMLRRHVEGLLNFSGHRITNACAEGFNNAIQLIKANARGFRNFANYRTRILFHCGKLNLAVSQ
jgi:transposase